jgi:cyclopropane-fatty-acyl-phospholipid synthase
MREALNQEHQTPQAPARPTLRSPKNEEHRSDEALRAARMIISLLFGQPIEREFDVEYWDGSTEEGLSARFTLIIARPGALRRMLLPPSEMSMIRSYVSGDMDVQGNFEDAISLGDIAATRVASATTVRQLLHELRSLPQDDHKELGERRFESDRRQRPDQASEEAIQFHYDVGNDFYALWLDPRMLYSCAYFQSGAEDLATAQVAKLNHICRKLRLQPGDKLLDIGCGWGGLIIHAAAEYGVDATGITLSTAQAQLARERIADRGLADRCRVELCDYREMAGAARFDRIVSVGMMEHVRADAQREYFATAQRLLRPGGLFLNHCIVSEKAAHPRSLRTRLLDRLWRRNEFIDRYVFPESGLVPLSHVIAAAESTGFETRDVESLREHYILTLRQWLTRLESAHKEARAIVGEQTYRTWRLYLSGAAHGFRTASTNVVQSLFVKTTASGEVDLPLTRAWMYQ